MLTRDAFTTKSVKNKITGDAIVSKLKNIGIGILTADCAPILFYDPKKKIIGCVHSGWRGALNGVIKKTVEKFNEFLETRDDPKWEKIASNGRKFALENFNNDAAVNSLVDLIKELI